MDSNEDHLGGRLGQKEARMRVVQILRLRVLDAPEKMVALKQICF